jgi:16S rRNA (guanine527-N7)-methyltransferase
MPLPGRRARPVSARGFTWNGSPGRAGDDVDERLAEHAARYGLDRSVVAPLRAILELLASEPVSLTSVRDPREAADVHVADSLAGLVLEEVRAARAVADLGSGGGFPGLPLAAALPHAEVALVESAAKKCEFLRRAASAAALRNVTVVPDRAESWIAGLRTRDLVVARALAALPVLVEYAAPLLVPGGALVAWKGRRDATEEADGAAAAKRLGMSAPRPLPLEPYGWSGRRHLYISLKVADTPRGYPRRPGMARKRPLRAKESA